jgi:serine protease
MTRSSLSTFGASLVFALLIASSAQAERFLLVLKNKQVFSYVHSQIVLSEKMNLAAVNWPGSNKMGIAAEGLSNIDVESSLENLNSLVINADSKQDLQNLSQSNWVYSIESEVFHPNPKPISGFVLTSPWDYQINQTVDMSGSLKTGEKTPWGIFAVKAPEAWAVSSAGKGVRVGVLDTGIDKDHPALKTQIEEMRDFVGDNNEPYDVADKVGHGSHVAGTIAGAQMTDGFVGVAPNAKVLVGRVCGEKGCSNISVAAGINWAISKKVDIISMSLGGPVGTPAERRAVLAAENAGISVIAATGNDGKPLVSYPAAFPTVVAVGAVDSKIQKAKFSNWGPQVAIVAPGVDVVSSVPTGSGRESKVVLTVAGQSKKVESTSFVGAPEIPQPVSNSLVVAGLGKPEDFKGIGVDGKFALVKRGEIPFADKVKNAIAANAAGVIIYNNEPGLIQGAITQDGSTVQIPVIMIEMTAGEDAAAKLKSGAVVLASIATIATDYASFAGTSMATPHVAGVVALMRGANKKITPADIKSILQSTATPLTPNDQNQTGSGMVNAEKAVTAAANK